jgi:hypothetical protein
MKHGWTFERYLRLYDIPGLKVLSISRSSLWSARSGRTDEHDCDEARKPLSLGWDQAQQQDHSWQRMLSFRTRKLINRAATTLGLAAKMLDQHSAYIAEGAELGTPKGIAATARKLDCLVV